MAHGFDNSAAGLVLSPALMEAYFDASTLAADGLFPPSSRPVEPARFTVGPKEFTYAETAGRVVADSIRMVTRTPQIADSNYAERDEVKHIVRAHVASSQDGAGFRDLLLDLIQSDAFWTR